MLAMPTEASEHDLERFRQDDDGRALVMVQLLRFAEGGRDRYLQYSVAAQPILTRIGAQILYAGECTEPLVAAEGRWDAVVLVRYPSRSAYVEMLRDPAYQEIAPLRRSALSEAALLPMDDWPGR
jgi:uncharacterized protein (DUF1330 family)